MNDYAREIDYSLNAQKFVDYYDSCGWVIGKGKPMKDWRASVRYWQAQDGNDGAETLEQKLERLESEGQI